jgi:molecular chaperone DnaK
MTSIGIDLGTTNSVISRLVQGRAIPIPIDGDAIVPSVVLFDGERFVTGRKARNLELLHPERTARSVKRRMGTSEQLRLGDRLMSPEEVSAEILKALRAGAEEAIGAPVRDVVITVPAYFDDAQRRATLRAGELAGLSVLRLLNEPTSASLCYEQVGPRAASTEPEYVMVYDLGGGTFDVSILEVWEGVREVRATAGDTRLGGDDFDELLVQRIARSILASHGVDLREGPVANARLRRLAEETKIRLSSETRVQVNEEFVTGGDGVTTHVSMEITRRELEESIGDLLRSTIELAGKALEDANLPPGSLSRILLVGGSTRIPLVRQLLEERFRVPVHEEVDVDLAVGLGAAIQSAILQDEPVERVLVDVTAHSLGIRTLGADDVSADTFSPVLRRNTVLPASRTSEFYTVVERQERLKVEVFQGEEPRASRNHPVGSFMCDLEPAPEGSPLAVTFAYDLDGIVAVTIEQPGFATKKTVRLSIADTSRDGDADNAAGSSAVERRATELLSQLDDDKKARLERLLADLRGAPAPEQRSVAEDALLDFFLDAEGEDKEDMTDDEERGRPEAER